MVLYSDTPVANTEFLAVNRRSYYYAFYDFGSGESRAV